VERAGLRVSAQQNDAPSATPDQLAQLADILNRPEFRAAEGRGYLDRLLDPIRAWLLRLLGALLRMIGRGIDAGGQPLEIGLVLLGLAVVLVAVLGVRRFLHGALVGDAKIDGERASRVRRAVDELAGARALAQIGDARRAVHHHYLAVLLRLDERDHLPFDGTLTNRELVPRLGASPELAEAFAALVASFDQLWYGQASCTLDEYAAFARLADRAWAAAEIPPSRPAAATGSVRAPATATLA